MSERDNDNKYQYREDRVVTDEELEAFIKKQHAEQEERINRMLEAAKKERAENVRLRAERRTAEQQDCTVTVDESTRDMEEIDPKFYAWDWIMGVVFFAETLTFSFLAFGVNQKAVFGSIVFHIIVCGIMSALLYSLIVAFVDRIDNNGETLYLKRRIWISICILLFIASSIILSQVVLAGTKEYQENEYFEQTETVCYITDTGDCYHKEYCGYLHSKIKTTVSSAKAQGYRPCTACWSDTSIQEQPVTKYKTEHHYVLSYFISLIGWTLICILVDLFYVRIKKKISS